MTDLAQREAAFRASLDPTMPVAEVEDAVTDWLRRQPESVVENRRIIRSRLDSALNELRVVDEYAGYLGWDVTEWELADICKRIADLRRAVEDAVGVTVALPGRLIDGAEVVG